MTTEEILHILDHANDGYYCWFVEMNHANSYLIDSRLNIFRAQDDRWAVVAERLGFSTSAGVVQLEIYYYGNCLKNLDTYNSRHTNVYTVYPIDFENQQETIGDEVLLTEASSWLVRGQKVLLSRDGMIYQNAGIELRNPGEIRVEEAARLIVLQQPNLFRATDDELYKSVPADLKKILVLDEWFHLDFVLQPVERMTDEHIRQTYEFNKQLTGLNLTYEELKQSIRERENTQEIYNKQAWMNNRPSSYETWQLLAQVIVANDPTRYKPTRSPNTHWKNWPASGSF